MKVVVVLELETDRIVASLDALQASGVGSLPGLVASHAAIGADAEAVLDVFVGPPFGQSISNPRGLLSS